MEIWVIVEAKKLGSELKYQMIITQSFFEASGDKFKLLSILDGSCISFFNCLQTGGRIYCIDWFRLKRPRSISQICDHMLPVHGEHNAQADSASRLMLTISYQLAIIR